MNVAPTRAPTAQSCEHTQLAVTKRNINKVLVLVSILIILLTLLITLDSVYNKHPLINRFQSIAFKKEASVHKIKPLTSFIASWRDFSTAQPVYFALPKKPVIDLADEDNELLEHTVAVIDKVLVIPEIKPDRALKLPKTLSGSASVQREDKPHTPTMVNQHLIKVMA